MKEGREKADTTWSSEKISCPRHFDLKELILEGGVNRYVGEYHCLVRVEESVKEADNFAYRIDQGGRRV